MRAPRRSYTLAEKYWLATGLLEEEEFLRSEGAALPTGWLSQWAISVAPHLEHDTKGRRAFVKL